MNKQNTQQNIFLNGIGVLNYTIETKSIGISEFYLPHVPNVSSYTGEEPYSAFGWLFGGNNINFDISMVDGYLDNFRKNQVPGLKYTEYIQNEQTKYKFSGYCFSNLTELLSADYYNTCSGYIYGFVTGYENAERHNLV